MKKITEYWGKYFLTEEETVLDGKSYKYSMCSLCANQGRIDTRPTAISPKGNYLGRVNFCICPNGQALRKQAKKKDYCG